jgi:hypothetical protein
MIMRRWGILQGKEDHLAKDLKETTLPFRKLGRKYGVSSQAIHAFYKRQRIKRPERVRGHQTGECRLCQKLIQISKKSHSDFISSQTIKKQLGLIGSVKFAYHIGILRRKGLISRKFGRLRSQKAELAYKIYFKKRLPVRTIGWQVGLKNFHSLIKKHQVLGWNVPDPLFTYDSNDRRKTNLKMIKRKRRE